MSYTFQATIDLAAIKQLQLDQPLVVAAVREGRVLGLKRIDLKEVRKIEKIPVDVQFDLPPDENLQGIELRIAPEMPERSLIAFDAFVIQPPAEVIASLKPGASVNLGTYHIPDAIYKPWWIRCSRYHVHGRLVKRVWRQGGFGFCDEPVPGAMVELYDVDRICFWYRKDLITTAETDENGNFSISFLWCCRPWFFRPYDGWIIDRAHWEKLRELLRHLRRIAPRLPIPIPEPDPFTPIVLLNIFETLEKVAQFNQLPVASAAESSLVETGMSSVTPASSIASDLEASSRLLSVKLSPAALRVIQQIRVFCPIWAWRLYGDCRPDLLFRATQPVGGVVRMVYEEEFGNTRWDVPTTPDLNVLLLANEQAMSFNTCVPAAPAGDCLFLSGVGAIQIQDIGDISSGGVLAGYHYRNGPLFPAKPDEPFGGTIRINGLFGQGTVDVDYYKFQVAPWDGNPANLPSDATFQDVPTAHLEAVYKSYLGIDPVNPALTKPIEVVLGPTLIGGISGLYRSQESVRREYEAAHGGASPGPWGWLWAGHEWLATINTSYLPNSLVVFRAIGYTLNAGNLISRIMRRCTPQGLKGPVELLPLRLDNYALTAPPTTSPDIDILGILHNGVAVADFVCQDIELKEKDTLTIQFKVTDPQNHLSDFSLVALYRIGCSQGLTEPPQFTTANTYAEALAGGALRPHWGGGSYSVTVTVGPHNVSVPCSSCGNSTTFFQFSGAYDLRLGVWKRTTNGLYHIHYAEANATIIVRRMD